MRVRRTVTETITLPTNIPVLLHGYVKRRAIPMHEALAKLIASALHRLEAQRRYRNSPRGKAAAERRRERARMERLRAADATEESEKAMTKVTDERPRAHDDSAALMTEIRKAGKAA